MAADALNTTFKTGEISVTPDEHVNEYVKYVLALVDPNNKRGGIETQFNCLFTKPAMRGICDFYSVQGNILHVVDYKHGRYPIPAHENWQLLIYAAAINHYGLDGGAAIIRLHIYQPQSMDGETVKVWAINSADLKAYHEKIYNAANLALSEKPPACIGSHCRYCKAKAACPALYQASMQCAEDLILRELPTELTESEINNELLYLTHVKTILTDRFSALEALAIDRIKKGKRLRDYALEPSFSHLEWTCPLEDVKKLGDIYGLNLLKPAEAITPTQAKKYKEIKSIVDAFSARKQMGFKLKIDATIKEVFQNDTK
jgi:hypothetical protein